MVVMQYLKVQDSGHNDMFTERYHIMKIIAKAHLMFYIMIHTEIPTYMKS
jgi:hypothetical protein